MKQTILKRIAAAAAIVAVATAGVVVPASSAQAAPDSGWMSTFKSDDSGW